MDKRTISDHSLSDCGVLVCSALYILGLAASAVYCCRIDDEGLRIVIDYVNGLDISAHSYFRMLWLSIRMYIPAALFGFTCVGIFAVPPLGFAAGFISGFSIYALCLTGMFSGAHDLVTVFLAAAAGLLCLFTAFDASVKLRASGTDISSCIAYIFKLFLIFLLAAAAIL